MSFGSDVQIIAGAQSSASATTSASIVEDDCAEASNWPARLAISSVNG